MIKDQRQSRQFVTLIVFLVTVTIAFAHPSLAGFTPVNAYAVQQILRDGEPVTSAAGAMVTLPAGGSESVIRRGEVIAAGTRIDVPAYTVVVIVGLGGRSSITLRPGSSFTLAKSSSGELVTTNAGSTIFSIISRALNFFSATPLEMFTGSVR